MRIPLVALVSTLVAIGTSHGVSADVFDTAPTNDNTAANTKNELVHGSDQLHDLGASGGVADQDWYRISQKPYASYEIVVETTSSAIGPTLALELVDSAGIPVPGVAALPISTLGFSRSLRWHNGLTTTPPTSPIDDKYIRVKSGQCTTACTSNDVYRIRMYETTQFGARFNNGGGQETYYFMQNTTDYTIQTRLYFWGPTGTLLCQSVLVDIPPRALGIVDDDTMFRKWIPMGDVELCEPGGSIEGLSGHVTLVSNARFGDLRAQGSALDPFGLALEFDTEMPTRPR